MTLLNLDRVVIIAHRGGSALRPENTLAAFDHAVSLDVDAIECDVHLSRDGEVVVIHDPTLERTTSSTGAVADLTAEELAQVDAGARFGPDQGWPFRGKGFGVPTLRTLLTRYPQMPMIVEVKGEDPLTADRALAVIRESDAEHRVLVASFSDALLRHVRRVAPHLPTSASRPEVKSALVRSYFWMKPRLTGFSVLQVPFRFRGRRVLTPGYVRAARRVGIPVHSWIVDRPEDIRTILRWGVTGIISDRPDLAIEAVRATNAGAAALR